MEISNNKVTIIHLSDILCVWAYLSQIRIDELKARFGEKIEFKYHFISIFGSVNNKMKEDWGNRGGVSGYNKHVIKTSTKFPHAEINSNIWLKNTPTTSLNSHLFLKAVELLESKKELVSNDNKNTVFETLAWHFRLAFFRDLIDISNFDNQIKISEKLGLPVKKIIKEINNGNAFASLNKDLSIKEKYMVKGSPTFVFNDGRQILYGNVGYKVIEANIQELLNQTENQASWC